jgi:hypothetical protein
MLTRDFNEFEIRLGPDSPITAALTLRGRLIPSAEYCGDVVFPIAEVLMCAQALQQIVPAAMVPGAACPTEVIEFGQYLCSRLLPGQIAMGLDLAMQVSQEMHCRLRIRIEAPAKWQAVPWEFLIRAEDKPGQFLVLNRSVALVRTASDVGRSPALGGIHLPIRVLVVVCAPLDRPLLNATREITLLLEALAELIRKGTVAVDFVTGPNTVKRVVERLEREECHILHWIGHGETDGKGVGIVVEGDARKAGIADQSTLWNNIQAAHRPRLVLLNICKGATATEQTPFASLAHVFLQTGVAAVVAHQAEVEDLAATETARLIYHAAATEGLEDAMISARAGLMDGISWHTPVLFLHYGHGELFLSAPGGQADFDPGKLPSAAHQARQAGRWLEAAAYTRVAMIANPEDRGLVTMLAECETQEKLDTYLLKARFLQQSGYLELAIKQYELFLAESDGLRSRPVREEIRKLLSLVAAYWGIPDPLLSGASA